MYNRLKVILKQQFFERPRCTSGQAQNKGEKNGRSKTRRQR